MARTTQGQASWGISEGTSVTAVSGVITDIDVGEDPQMEPQRNEVGAVIKQTLYDRRAEVNVTVEVAAGTAKPKTGANITVAGVQGYVAVEVAAGTPKPKTGTAITVAGFAGYVTRSRVVESNQRYRAINITVEAYPNCKTVDDQAGSL